MIKKPSTPRREDLAKIFKEPRTLKAFEQVFELLPDELERQLEGLENVQVVAESATTQAALALALLYAIDELASIKAMEPVHQCNCQHDELTPRYEHVAPDHIEPTQIQYQELSTLEII
ncbi:MAG: hypothetical protein RSA84_18460 [Acinetobacter sp.]